MREAESKYHPDLNQTKDIDVDSDPRSGYTNKDLGSDKDKNSVSDTNPSIDLPHLSIKQISLRVKDVMKN